VDFHKVVVKTDDTADWLVNSGLHANSFAYPLLRCNPTHVKLKLSYIDILLCSNKHCYFANLVKLVLLNNILGVSTVCDA